MKADMEFDKDDYWRLNFHLMPPIGWLNDPNGLCCFQGNYHVFFQYSPYDTEGGLKYWGHYCSKDMINWDFHGIALSPDRDFERNGVYSGSAMVDHDRMHLFYTGNVKLEGDFDYITTGRQGNTIYTSSEDGFCFHAKECVLTNEDYPSTLSLHVRDPKVWMEMEAGSEKYYMVLGARTKTDVGEIIIYESNNLRDWKFVTHVTSPEPFGYMWECPDIFRTGDYNFLSISPQGVEADGLNYQNIYQSGYYLYTGSLTGEYCLGEFKEWDRGFDFYAPQTFEDEHGRRILIGWMGMPDTPEFKNPTVVMGWQHALTIPREILVKENKVLQVPLKEFTNLRFEKIRLSPDLASPMLKAYEVMIENRGNESLEIRINDEFTAYYNAKERVFGISFGGGENGIGRGRTHRGVSIDYCIAVNLYVDSSSIEIFLNNGEEVFTTRFYPLDGKSSITVSGNLSDIHLWQLRSMGLVGLNRIEI